MRNFQIILIIGIFSVTALFLDGMMNAPEADPFQSRYKIESRTDIQFKKKGQPEIRSNKELSAKKSKLTKSDKIIPDSQGHSDGWNATQADASVNFQSINAEPFEGGFLDKEDKDNKRPSKLKTDF
jgi:hypothetical protein